MPEPVKLEKAQLQELDSTLEDLAPGSQPVPVQFNPETLKLSFANQVQQPQSGGGSSGQQSRQFVGTGTTKLALQLWLDVTAQPLQKKLATRRLVAIAIKPRRRAIIFGPHQAMANNLELVPFREINERVGLGIIKLPLRRLDRRRLHTVLRCHDGELVCEQRPIIRPLHNLIADAGANRKQTGRGRAQ